ncbi:hypothetical protein [Flavobacterium bizetiae]|jgi:hypothetical protein|uniref:Uncharacterized protein n=1 Tax=Flavobacterium bizetiae TaxID=2704140 RepID=A0A6J4GBD4_9FLAO|nr:hypothetical protein [Flavobacterium bizetiae]UTN04046.1 hypothetical protein L0669_22310 [Flavobacterium bizetiae]CAA9194942.1 hypothetical protein FLA105534_00390 [Flavobacterium bizetiae]CAD5344501.1 hypothetical protein FLA105535_04507 [Flavobacterium bizetiae]CAD5346174.1 hypothetical protein FLA105534_00115 [Flavobacterium bizetiae]
MDTDLNTIHVFKTNITTVEPNCPLRKTLDEHQDIQQWSIDHEDVDCVLRVVSGALKPETIIGMINQFGHECQELN